MPLFIDFQCSINLLHFLADSNNLVCHERRSEHVDSRDFVFEERVIKSVYNEERTIINAYKCYLLEYLNVGFLAIQSLKGTLFLSAIS